MTEPQIRPLEPETAEEVAALIEGAFVEYRGQPPLAYEIVPPEWLSREAILEFLSGDSVAADQSFVAIAEGRPAAAVIARRRDEELLWWRIATAPEHRRRGLASACLRAAEEAARAAGEEQVSTDDPLDSRWEAAGALLSSAGYELLDQERRNIVMELDMARWQPRAVSIPPSLRLTTFSEDCLQQWIDCRNRAFESSMDTSWLREGFMRRADFDPAGWFMILDGERVVGFAAGVVSEFPAGADTIRGGTIEWVGVDPDYRGMKLGEAVVVASLNYLAEHGVERTILVTQPFRVPAIRLYEKLGFRTFSAYHKYVKAL